MIIKIISIEKKKKKKNNLFVLFNINFNLRIYGGGIKFFTI